MNNLEFAFDISPWEGYRRGLQMGDVISAARVLALVEGEQELEEALQDLETGAMVLDISDLPKPGGIGEAAVRLRREQELVSNGLRPEDLEQTDPLRLYLEEVAQTPAFGDEVQLAQRSGQGDARAQQALTNLGLSRVIQLAQEHVGYGVLLLDLIQEGSLGLWQAVCSYHGGDYAAHRDRWIRFYLARAVTMQAGANGVGQKMRRALEDYRQVDSRLLSDLGRNPTLEEIALELHMNVEEAATVRQMLAEAQQLARALTRYFGLPFIEPMDPVDGTVDVEYGTLNLRSYPSSAGRVIANLPDGATVRIFGQWEGWYVVRYEGQLGYAAAAYIDV